MKKNDLRKVFKKLILENCKIELKFGEANQGIWNGMSTHPSSPVDFEKCDSLSESSLRWKQRSRSDRFDFFQGSWINRVPPKLQICNVGKKIVKRAWVWLCSYQILAKKLKIQIKHRVLICAKQTGTILKIDCVYNYTLGFLGNCFKIQKHLFYFKSLKYVYVITLQK